jgi:hypothetical protein
MSRRFRAQAHKGYQPLERSGLTEGAPKSNPEASRAAERRAEEDKAGQPLACRSRAGAHTPGRAMIVAWYAAASS